MSNRLAELLLQTGLFNSTNETQLNAIQRKFSEKNFKSGEKIITANEEQHYIFIIEEGEVTIYNNEVKVAVLNKGALVGESGLIGEKASADVIADGEVRTAFISRNDMEEVIQDNPSVLLSFFKKMYHRVRESNQRALEQSRERERELELLVTQRTQELKKTNEELIVTRDDLLRVQQFRQQFLANMSHEIRTPMNAVIGLTNLLLKSPVNNLQAEQLRAIKKSGDNLLVIINDILDLSKIEAGKMELEKSPFSIKEAAENVFTIMKLKAEEKGISFKLAVDKNLPSHVAGDETRLTQMLTNLTGNAIKFSAEGEVRINVQTESITQNQTQIKFSVTDTGIGIPKDKLDKVFEIYGQASAGTTRKFGGTGLGLTITRQLAELHGGSITVESAEGKGSTFSFTIPFEISETPKSAESETAEAEIATLPFKLLLVEDNEFNRMVAVHTIKDLFPLAKMEIAKNGKEAIDEIEKNDFQIILMDIIMPEMNGYEAARYIRNKMTEPKRSVKICAMTASVMKAEIEECFSSGMNDFLMKPFDPETLKSKIIHLLKD